MRCYFCGRNLTNDEEEYEDDSKGLNYEILHACIPVRINSLTHYMQLEIETP